MENTSALLSRLGKFFRPHDLIWFFVFGLLAVSSPERDPKVVALILLLGVVQVVEPHLSPAVAVILKLAICYGMIGWGGGISSSLYLVLLLPTISAATNFEVWGTVASTLGAVGVYLSFLLWLKVYDQYVDDDQIWELVFRCVFIPVVAFLTYQIASQKREEAAKLKETAERLQEAQAQIRRSERLAALGQLSAGLAHELRNPLGTMKSSAELLGRNIPADNEIAKEMAGYIGSEVDRTNSLITRFLDFARPEHLRIEKSDISALLDRVIQRFQRERAPNAPAVSLYTNYSPDIPVIPFDAELLERVFYNLIDNAAQASAPGASITVKTKPAGDHVEISVIDRGSGIDPKNLENIFNPFFTTKQGGVGLGLAIVSKIIDEHAGRINVESTPGEGTVFRVYLPVAQ
jgi:signal transduction histidine kinase